MSLKKMFGALAAALMMSAAMLSTPVMAQSESGFSALQGVEGEALSVAEMEAIAGELNAYDIAGALYDKALALAKFPRLQAAVVKLADYYRDNAVAINTLFMKLGIFTPCKSCGAP